jgi:hypothetical protein
MAKIAASLNRSYYIPPMENNRPKVRQPMFFESRRGLSSSKEKAMAGILSNNIEKVVNNYLSKTDIHFNGLGPMLFKAAKNLMRATPLTCERLISQDWLSAEELTDLKNFIPFTPLMLGAKIARSLLECHTRKLSPLYTSILMKKFILPEDLFTTVKRTDISISGAIYLIKMRKNSDPEKAIKQAVSIASSLAKNYGVSDHDAIWFVKAYKDPEEKLCKAINLAKHLAEKHNISFLDAMYFAKANEDPEEKIIIAVKLAKQLEEKYRLSPYDAMWFAKRYSDPEKAVNRAMGLTKQLSHKYGLCSADAMFFVKKYKDPEVSAKRAVALAQHLAEKYRISSYDVMSFIKSHKDPERAIKTVLPIVKILAEKYRISFSDAMHFEKEYKDPEEAISRAILRMKDLSEKYGISASDSMYFIKEHKDPEQAISKAILAAKQLAEKHDISFYDAMSFVKKYKDPEASLNTMLNRKAAIELSVPKRKDLPQSVYKAILNAALFSDDYLEVANYHNRKLDELSAELANIKLPLPDAIVRLSLLYGTFIGKLLCQAFGGAPKPYSSNIAGDHIIGHGSPFNDGIGYKHIDHLTPLSILTQPEEMEEQDKKAERIRHILSSALSAEEDLKRRLIKAEILSQLLSEKFEPNELAKKLNITLDEITQNTEALFSVIRNSPQIKEALSAIGVLRRELPNRRMPDNGQMQDQKYNSII